jgi:hypothetical protein
MNTSKPYLHEAYFTLHLHVGLLHHGRFHLGLVEGPPPDLKVCLIHLLLSTEFFVLRLDLTEEL